MKRLLVLAALALGLSVVLAPAAAPAGDAKGPPCGNVTGGAGAYTSGGVVDFTAFLDAPACSFVTYTFTVTDATSGNEIEPVSATSSTESCTAETTGGGCVHFVYTLPTDSPSVVCVSAETYIHGHLVDRAPDASPSNYCLVQGGAGASG